MFCDHEEIQDVILNFHFCYFARILTQKSRVVKTDTSSLDVLLTPAVYSKSFRVEEGVAGAEGSKN